MISRNRLSVLPQAAIRAAAVALVAGFALLATPALATTFTVHSYELGERISLYDGRQVNTALLDASLGDMRGAWLCVDLDTYITTSAYNVRAVLDPFVDPSPADEAPRDFAWAGFVMNSFGFDVDRLVSATVTRVQAITGVQAALWDGLYGGGIVNEKTLSDGARSVFHMVMASFEPLGGEVEGGNGGDYFADGNAQVVDLVGNQDQIFTKPIPEPSAALVFGIGALLVSAARRRA